MLQDMLKEGKDRIKSEENLSVRRWGNYSSNFQGPGLVIPMLCNSRGERHAHKPHGYHPVQTQVIF